MRRIRAKHKAYPIRCHSGSVAKILGCSFEDLEAKEREGALTPLKDRPEQDVCYPIEEVMALAGRENPYQPSMVRLMEQYRHRRIFRAYVEHDFFKQVHIRHKLSHRDARKFGMK